MGELPESLQLEIVSPDRLLYSGDVQEVTIPGMEGYLGILPGHAPLLSELRTGIISYSHSQGEAQLFCLSGFAEVLPERVIVLAEQVEFPEEIDDSRARADKEKAEEILKSRDPEADYEHALTLLEQASIRLQLVE